MVEDGFKRIYEAAIRIELKKLAVTLLGKDSLPRSIPINVAVSALLRSIERPI